MKRCLTLFMLAAFGMVAAQGSRAEQVTVSGAPVYVTKGDCMALVRHHPSVGTAYQPGTDVHGKYVAPADLPNSNPSYALSEKVQFQLKINPMAYGQAGGRRRRAIGGNMPIPRWALPKSRSTPSPARYPSTASRWAATRIKWCWRLAEKPGSAEAGAARPGFVPLGTAKAIAVPAFLP